VLLAELRRDLFSGLLLEDDLVGTETVFPESVLDPVLRRALSAFLLSFF
jgi:hypothetical protein